MVPKIPTTLDAASSASGEDDASLRARTGEGVSASRIKILLVEDEVFVAMDEEAILSEAGYDIVGTAASADDAVAKVAQFAPDLVLMDIRLVGSRDGIDAALEIGRRFGTAVIFVTANNDAATLARAREARPIGIVPKPFTSHTLLKAVQGYQKG